MIVTANQTIFNIIIIIRNTVSLKDIQEYFVNLKVLDDNCCIAETNKSSNIK